MESDTRPPLKPMTAKRKKILEMAFEQLRKARAKINPSVLNKLRRMIAGSPELMKNLGVNEDLKPKAEKSIEPKIEVPVDEVSRSSRKEIIKERERIIQKAKDQAQKDKAQKEAAQKAKRAHSKKAAQPQEKPEYEKVDQAKNMEVLAKLMELHPKGRDMIKSAIKKASE